LKLNPLLLLLLLSVASLQQPSDVEVAFLIHPSEKELPQGGKATFSLVLYSPQIPNGSEAYFTLEGLPRQYFAYSIDPNPATFDQYGRAASFLHITASEKAPVGEYEFLVLAEIVCPEQKEVYTANATGRVLVVDATPPTVVILTPIDGETVSGTIWVNVTAEDNTAVDRVELYVDNILCKVKPSPPYCFKVNTLNLSDGEHLIRVVAYDIYGNGNSDYVRIVVRNAKASLRVEVLALASLLLLFKLELDAISKLKSKR